MKEKHLHIVSFDVPLPADYGGAIDVFYRIKALHQLGIKITLHCFEYGRGESEELKKYAQKVIYYGRRKKVLDAFSRLPFIVKTRISEMLLKNLLEDHDPILFEGLHTTFLLNNELLKDRLKIVRTHNIEHEYYEALSTKASGYKKQFFKSESKKLKAYEPQLRYADCILAIKESEAIHFRRYCENTKVLPACADIEFDFCVETEPYCLFQGNLSVPENEDGIQWLLDHVILPYNLEKQLKIAGKNPSRSLVERCEKHGIPLICNPDKTEMQELKRKARVHLFYSNQDSGIKLKLINALTTSGAILANNTMISGASFGHLCEEVNSPEEYATKIDLYLKASVSQIDLEPRRSFLNNHLDPVKNCKTISEML